MPYKRGAPKGNRNRLKHGRFAAARLDLRREVRAALRDSRRQIALARGLLRTLPAIKEER